MRVFLFCVFALILTALSAVCLGNPRAVRSFAVRTLERGSTPEVVKTFVRSDSYLWNVRGVGLMALVLLLFLAYAALKGS